MAFRNISIVISAATGEASRNVELLGKQLEGFGHRATGVNKSMLALGTGLAVAAVASVKMAADFQRAMELIHTQAGASQAEVDAMRNSILKLAPAVGEGPVKLADAMYHIESIGLRGAKALDVLHTAAMGAQIGNADLEQTTNALASTIASNIGGFHGMKDAMAILNNTVGQGNMRMDDLAASMSTGVLPAAKTAGLGLIDVGAALATMTDTGVPAEEAATRLRMTFALMSAPTGAAEKALKGIGLSATDLANDMHRPNGLLLAVEDLRAHLGNLHSTAGQIAAEDVLVKAFGGGRSSGAIMTLIQEVDRLQTKYASYGTVASRQATFQDAWAKTTEEFSFKMHQLGAELQVVAIRVGTALIPVVLAAVSGLQQMAHWIAESTRWLHDHEAVVAAVGAAWLAIKWGAIAQAAATAMFNIRVALTLVELKAGQTAAAIGGVSGALARLSLLAAAAALGYTLVKELQAVSHAGQDTQHSIDQVMGSLGKAPDLTSIANARAQIEELRKSLKDPTAGSWLHQRIQVFDPHQISQVRDYRAALAELDAAEARLAEPERNLRDNLNLLAQRYEMTTLQVKNFATAHRVDLTQSVGDAGAAFDKAVIAVTHMTGASGAVVAAYTRMDAALKTWHDNLAPATDTLAKQFDLLDKLPDKLRLTGAELLKQVQAQAKALVSEGANVRKLVAEGLDPATIKALVEKGPEYVAAAAALSLKNLGRFGHDYNAAQTALHQTAADIARAEAPAAYQAVIDAAEAKKKAIAEANYRAFVAQLLPAIATARQVAESGSVTTMDAAGHKVVDSAPKMLQAYLRSLPEPLRRAVAVAIGVSRQGGLDMVAAVATAIVSATPRAGQSARVMTKAIQEEINALRGTKVAVTVDELIAKASFRAQWEARSKLFPFFSTAAAGGPITGGRPGRDSVPILAMPDEHMLTVEDVKAMGGHAGVLAFRKALHMAAGGPVVADVIQHPPAGMVAPPAKAEAARYATQTAKVFERMFAAAMATAGGPGAVSTGQYVQLGQIMAAAYGWVGPMFAALNKLWTRESNWNPWAVNPTSGAYGIPQSLGHGHPYNLGDAQAQILWGLAYIAGRYGNPANAWGHEVRFGWYDQGGYLPPGYSVAFNGTGRPEPVGQNVGAQVSAALARVVGRMTPARPPVNIIIHPPAGMDVRALAAEVSRRVGADANLLARSG